MNWFIAFSLLYIFNLLHNLHAFNHLTKHNMLPSKCEGVEVVMKNWLPLVFGPEFAMLRRPSTSCFKGNASSGTSLINRLTTSTITSRKISSLNHKVLNHPMEGTTLKWSGLPDLPTPRSPVQSARKFSAVLGTTPAYNSISIRPRCFWLCSISKNTFGRGPVISKGWLTLVYRHRSQHGRTCHQTFSLPNLPLLPISSSMQHILHGLLYC